MGNKIVKNVGIILCCSIVAKILSYVWVAILASVLGASDQADALYMTTSIFAVLYPILDLGIWKVFLPIYKTKLVENEETKAEKLANIAITLFFILSVFLVVFLVIFASPITSVMALGFSPEKQALTVQYLRISAPTYLLMATASVVGAMLQSRERFLGSQIREIGTHISKIVYIFAFYQFMGIYAAVTAMIVGSVFRLLIQLPFIDWKWRFRPNFSFRDEDIIPMIKGLPSVAVTATIANINGLIDKVIASGAGSGSVACLNYGNKLLHVFSGMISSAIATAVYPTVIQYIAEKNDDKLNKLLIKVIGALGFIIIPISIFCIFFSENIVRFAFQRGAFDAAATTITASVFVGYCIGMFFMGVATIITNAFYAYGDTKITMHISIIEIILNLIFNLCFVRYWGVAGLAFATSFSAIISLGIRFFFLKRYIFVDYKTIVIENIKVLFLALFSCYIPFMFVTKVWHGNTFIILMVGCLLCSGLYLLLAFVFKISTLDFVIGLVKKK